MNILVLAQDFPPIPGGVSIFLHNLCSKLCCLGHCVDVLVPVRENSREIDVEQLYRVYRYLSKPFLSSLVPIIRTLTLHRQHNYDVVFIGHFMTTHALGGLMLHQFYGVPYAVLSHGNDLDYSRNTRVDELVARVLLRRAAVMLGNSSFTADRIREVGYTGPVEVLHPGVDSTRFRAGVDTTQVQTRYGLNGRRVLLTVARLVPKKNVDGVLCALSHVLEQVPNLLYLVVGDGKERGRLEELCRKLGLHSHVRFLGHIENEQLPALYCASDVFVMPSSVMPSSVETFGISFLEANACGVPVIGGQSGGVEDAVIDDETGLLVNPQDVDGIATAITRLLTDEHLAHRLGENGRRRVERELSWERVGERLEKALEKLVERV